MCVQCQPEYKLPGLYVIDAIVRESRRQFSPEKDLFAPRFSKNFEATFQNLLMYCPPSDKVRVCLFRYEVFYVKSRKCDICRRYCALHVTSAVLDTSGVSSVYVTLQ